MHYTIFDTPGLSFVLRRSSSLILGIFGFGAGILLSLALQSGARIPLFRDEFEVAADAQSEFESADAR